MSFLNINPTKVKSDVINYCLFESTCGVTPEGTRVDFPPPTLEQEKSVDIATTPESLPENKTRVDVSSMSVEADESNTGREIIS